MPKHGEEVCVPNGCKDCEHWEQVEDRVRIRSVLSSMIDKIETNLEKADFKPSVADLLKLLEAKKDLELPIEAPKELSVRWKDPAAPLQN